MSLSELFNLPPENIIKPVINDVLGNAINVYLANLSGNFKESDTFRCSGISFLCPRQNFFQFYNPKEFKFQPKIKLKTQLGTLLHKYIQDKVLGPAGILKGIYKNVETKEEIEGFHPEPEKSEYWEYKEYTLKDNRYNLSGHIDGLISIERLNFIEQNKNLYKNHFHQVNKEISKIETKEFYLLDIKSLGQRNYNLSLTGDVPDYYKTQANLYLDILNLTKMYFLNFETENFSFFGKIYNKEQRYVDDAHKKIIATNNQFLVGEPTHEYRACTSEKDKRAKECPHREACFNYKVNYKELVEKSSNKHSGIKLPILDG